MQQSSLYTYIHIHCRCPGIGELGQPLFPLCPRPASLVRERQPRKPNAVVAPCIPPLLPHGPAAVAIKPAIRALMPRHPYAPAVSTFPHIHCAKTRATGSCSGSVSTAGTLLALPLLAIVSAIAGTAFAQSVAHSKPVEGSCLAKASAISGKAFRRLVPNELAVSLPCHFLAMPAQLRQGLAPATRQHTHAALFFFNADPDL